MGAISLDKHEYRKDIFSKNVDQYYFAVKFHIASNLDQLIRIMI